MTRMNLAHLGDLIRRILATQEHEIDCGELYDVLAQFVDLELAGQQAASILPYVEPHLEQCPDCRELYETLREAAEREARDSWPDIQTLLDEIVNQRQGGQ